MKKIKFFSNLFLFVCLFSLNGMAAQQGMVSDIEMATDLYRSGKIYVVVLCLVVIFLGLSIFLFSLDRKLRKLENSIHS